MYEKGEMFYTAVRSKGSQFLVLAELLDTEGDCAIVNIVSDPCDHFRDYMREFSTRRRPKSCLFPKVEGFPHKWGEDGFDTLQEGDDVLVARDNKIFKETIVRKTAKQARTENSLIRRSRPINFVTLPKGMARSGRLQ